MNARDDVTRWGPDGKRGAFSLTFDNFGEAFELEVGFAGDAPIGQHPTAGRLPDFLQIVKDLPVTYFIEASNVGIYPEHIKRIRDAGVEIGLHAWRHENWGKQSAEQRRDILQRSMAAFATLGVAPKGFRPPGGVMPEGSLQEFADCGMTYCSPLGGAGETRIESDIAIFPFAWPHVDAYMLDPRLGALRASFGDPEAVVTFPEWEKVLKEAVATALSGKHVTMIFHPYLFEPDERMTNALKALIRTLRATPDLWLANCNDVANWMLREDEDRR